MMYLPDFRNAVADYLTNSGQDPEEWDIEEAATELRDKYPEAESIDDVDADDLIAALESHEA
jgi:hypothetical protein